MSDISLRVHILHICLSMWGLLRTMHVDDVGQGCYGGSHSNKRYSQGDGPAQLRRAQSGRLGRFNHWRCSGASNQQNIE